jgi:alcohol dehydrogenase
VKFSAAVLRQAGAARPYARSRPLAIEQVELPDPGPGEVLVRIRAVSLCHSDLSVINGDRRWPLPIVPGHEAAGTIELLGPDVTAFAVGDRVALIFLTQCGSCARCMEGKSFLCERGTQANREGRLITGGPHLRLNGVPLHHHMGLGAFAEYAVVAEKSLVHLPAEIGFVEASLFGCAVMCGTGSALYTARVAAGERVAVIGLGGVGLAAIMGARLAGATRIVAVDLTQTKGELALACGATEFFSAEDARNAERVDVALEATGTVAGFELALELTRRGGRTVTTSLPAADQAFHFPLARLVAEARTISGSYIGACLPNRDIPAFIALYQQGRLPVDRLVTRTIGLNDINAAMDALADARVVRQVIVF